MKLITIRRLFKLLIVPGILLVALLLLDYALNEGRAFAALTLVAILYIIVLLVFLLLPYERREFVHIQSPEVEPMSTHYPPLEARE